MSNIASPAVAPPDLVELGRIVAAYGVKGWVKVQPHSADADVLLAIASGSSAKSSSASTWWLIRPAPPGTLGASSGKSAPAHSYAIRSARSHGSHVVAQLEGVDDRDQAEALKGMAVCAPRSAFPAPDEDEYYWVDLIGCTVYGEDNGAPVLMGTVDEVVDNGAHAILKVRRQRPGGQGQQAEPLLDSKGRPVEVLVPFVHAHIRAVDLAGRRIDTDWPLDF
ncbi:ribosome maturation factor RimM [Bordetella genomosp. 11]|uniref:Ribosome maturation factor RimM n=1 Tax=Bordetella genomosp. 11 TaxID=1416808 RepID=A0A261UE93_9BORD|nr:ribosome maturation factor RimM [Bordetella genomosp. 11]OZI59827.1 ribosome maturation factor RimM [Bordetella genomosp. 11]